MRLWVAYGTSLTAEKSRLFWRRCGGSWLSLLRDHIDSQGPNDILLINRSRWGADSRWALKNITSRTLSMNPDMLFLEFAINDADVRKRITRAESRDNLEKMITLARKHSPACEICLLISHSPSGRHLRVRPALLDYYQIYREVAEQRDVGIVDLYACWGPEAPTAQYMPDGIHTNELAAREVILPAILSSLKIQ